MIAAHSCSATWLAKDLSFPIFGYGLSRVGAEDLSQPALYRITRLHARISSSRTSSAKEKGSQGAVRTAWRQGRHAARVEMTGQPTVINMISSHYCTLKPLLLIRPAWGERCCVLGGDLLHRAVITDKVQAKRLRLVRTNASAGSEFGCADFKLGHACCREVTHPPKPWLPVCYRCTCIVSRNVPGTRADKTCAKAYRVNLNTSQIGT
jgi:hypothetical protein